MSKPLFCILGCSASGKTTICSKLEQEYGLKQIPSYTTRKPRFEGENGHIFISKEEFDRLNDVIAYTCYLDNDYGVTSEQIDNENYELYVVDLTGLKYLKERYYGKRRIISIYIDTSLSTRYRRLHERYVDQYVEYDDFYAIATDKSLRRIFNDLEEFTGSAEYCDFRINNDGDINDTIAKLVNIIERSY